MMMFSVGSRAASGGWRTITAPAGQPLADIVVGVAEQFKRNAARQKGAEAAAGSAAKADPDRVRRQPGMAVAPRQLAREHRAHGAVHVADRQLDAHRLAPFKGRLRRPDQLVVERPVEVMLLPLAIMDRDPRPRRDRCNRRDRSMPLAFQCSIARGRVEPVDPADHLAKAAEAEPRHQLAHFLGDEEEIVDDVLGLPGEAGAQHRVLGGDRRPGRC